MLKKAFFTRGYLWSCTEYVFQVVFTSSTTGTPLPLVQYYYVVTTLDHSPSCKEFTRVQFYPRCCTPFTRTNSSTPLNAQGLGSRFGMLSAELPCMQMTWCLWLAPQKNVNRCWTLSRIEIHQICYTCVWWVCSLKSSSQVQETVVACRPATAWSGWIPPPWNLVIGSSYHSPYIWTVCSWPEHLFF